MARFSVRNASSSTVPVGAHELWEIITDPNQLAALTPLIDSIEADGMIWVWKLHPIEALGLKVEAEFTELMRLTELERIEFEHSPPKGHNERVGAAGIYEFTPDGPTSTALAVDLTLSVDLPVPRLAARSIEGVMRASMQATGRRFARNLYELLGLDPATATITEIAEP